MKVTVAQRPSTVGARTKEVLFGVALLLAAASIACAVAEFAVRMVAPQQLVLVRPDIWMPVDTLGWTKRPNVKTSVNTGDRTISLFTDSLGQRVGPHGPRAAAKHVLLLGDSFMEALSVEHEESIAGQLESRLSALAGEPVRVDNTGVGGWDPSQYLLQASRSLGRERYDLVLVAVYLGNDIAHSRTTYFPPRELLGDTRLRWPRQLAWREVVEAVFYPLNQFLEERSHLFVLAKTRLSTLRMRLGLSRLYFPTEHLRSERSSSRWDTTASILADIAAAASRIGVPTAFVFIPSNFQVHREIMDAYVAGFGLDTTTIDLEQPNDLLSERLVARGLSVYDPLPHLQSLGGRKGYLFGAVDTHLNAAGHREIAAWLAPQLARYAASASRP